jgi:hypothetical protein
LDAPHRREVSVDLDAGKDLTWECAMH